MTKKSILSISFAVALILLLFACKDNNTGDPVDEVPMGKLQLIESIFIDVLEPSGLSFGPDKNTLLTVSDNTGKIYELSLSGETIRELAFEGTDLEGVSYNDNDNTIAVIEEGNRKVVIVNYSTGEKMQEFVIQIENSSDNKGLEGISYNSNNSIYYIVNEDAPGKLVLWTPDNNIISEIDLKFAADYSGIFVDAVKSNLWILSDESRSLSKCDYSANVLLKFSLDKLKYEGVVIDDSLAYLINDATAELKIYQIQN